MGGKLETGTCIFFLRVFDLLVEDLEQGITRGMALLYQLIKLVYHLHGCISHPLSGRLSVATAKLAASSSCLFGFLGGGEQRGRGLERRGWGGV